jgi:AraC family transcriptional regulator of adaptative response/methylated-DNA-[protein]-cysteine methyltransferase
MLMLVKNPDFALSLDDERWQAVLERDRRRDGEFVFAVRSTGIYCRPSCPARRPRRENVHFFADPKAAERAGFRACRRCRPRAEATSQEALVARATAWLDAHAEERVTLARLAAELGVSGGHLQRTFTKIAGVSPHAYAAARRLENAKAHMRDGADVTSALYAAGYGSSSRFYDQARTELGMTPATYRRGGEGMTIDYTTADSPLGRLLVAATERGICMVSIGDDDAALEGALAGEYPRAMIRQDDDALFPLLAAVLGHLMQRKLLTAFPLDVAGTPFQREVWQAPRAIPAGERRSYGEVAASIGKPGAARAVANACAANPVAIIIPSDARTCRRSKHGCPATHSIGVSHHGDGAG